LFQDQRHGVWGQIGPVSVVALGQDQAIPAKIQVSPVISDAECMEVRVQVRQRENGTAIIGMGVSPRNMWRQHVEAESS
jgi:hypothetical protein